MVRAVLCLGGIGTPRIIPSPAPLLCAILCVMSTTHRRILIVLFLLNVTIPATAEEEKDKEATIASWTSKGQAEKEQAHYQEALNAYQKAFALVDKAADPKTYATLELSMAAMHVHLTSWKESEPLYREALSLRESACGKDAPETAEALTELAMFLYTTKRLKEAEPLMRRGLAIDEATSGKDHPTVAKDLNNLAMLLKATGRLDEAEPLMVRVIDIWDKSPDKNDPKLAVALTNLAQVFKATERPKEAEPLMRRAIAIGEINPGPDHPDVAIRLYNLAMLFHDTKRLAEAEPLMKRALVILVNFSNKNERPHSQLQLMVTNYANILSEMGQTKEEVNENLGKIIKMIGQIK